jgi:ABC-type bacteriocin/lantibiotic exporter with double-glycine peptidase domain/CRP-like cAMP-binding protein
MSTAELLGDLPLLAGLDSNVRDLVIDSFVEESYAFGEEIVRQGDEPDGFYLVVSGRARVLRDEHGMEVPLAQLGVGDTFGEAGLLDGERREATVRASSPTTVQRLEPALFRAIVRRSPEVAAGVAAQARARRLQPLLRSHPLFAALADDALGRLAGELREQTAEAGTVIITEGDPAGPLFLIVHGRARVTSGSLGDLNFLRAGDVFGELSLLTGAPRAATVEAVSDVRLAVLDPEVHARFEADHPELQARVAERKAIYQRGPATHVPIDFAEDVQPAPDDTNDTTDAAHTTDGLGAPATSGRRGRRSRHHVPHVRQLDEMDCGAACVTMVTESFGYHIDRSHIRDVVGTSVDGTTLAGITRGARAIGLEVQPLKASKDRLDELPLPAIAHWKGKHWLVVDEVTPTRVHVADPAAGPQWKSRDEFVEHWTGFTALVGPTPALAAAPADRARFGWLVPFVRPHRRAISLVVVLALVAATLQMFVPVVTGRIVDSVVGQKDYGALFALIGGLLALQVVALGAGLLQARVVTRVAAQVDTEALAHIASRMLRLPLSYFESRRSGDIERRLDGVRQVREFASQRLIPSIGNLGRVVAAVVLMGFLSPPLMALWLVTLPIYVVIVRIGTRRVRPAYEAEEEGSAQYRSRQLDAIRGVETVKSMGVEDGVRGRMLRDADELTARGLIADRVAINYGGAVTFTTFVLLVVFLFVASLEVMAGNLSVGDLVAFNSLVLLASAPVLALLDLTDQWQLMTVLMARLSDILEREPEQADGDETLRPVPSLEGRVSLTNVGFGYPEGSGDPILKGITLEVDPGTTVAIVGRSGAGKSTLLKCIAGLLEASEGVIAFDSVDLRGLRWRELRRRIGLVPQTPYVFDDTLARNIAFGEDVPDMNAVRSAAEIANANDFIERLPLGYDTHVGDGGMRLSGGEAQRVAIARSIYHRPPVLLLDEATSALDTEAERTVNENVKRLLEARTAFVVAHRLSTVRDADLIIVLEQGRIAELGTHDELLTRGGLYVHLYGQQLSD